MLFLHISYLEATAAVCAGFVEVYVPCVFPMYAGPGRGHRVVLVPSGPYSKLERGNEHILPQHLQK